MKKRAVSMLLTAVMAVTGMAATATVAHAEGEEGKVINIYSWNDEFRTRLEAIYPEVESTSSDGTVTTLKDGTEIHWIINPNQDGVYQQKLDEALLNQADASADDKVDIFLSETEYAELKEDYPDRLERFIEELSQYIAATGKDYRNYAAAVRMWADRDRKGAAKQGVPDYSFKEGESL